MRCEDGKESRYFLFNIERKNVEIICIFAPNKRWAIFVGEILATFGKILRSPIWGQIWQHDGKTFERILVENKNWYSFNIRGSNYGRNNETIDALLVRAETARCSTELAQFHLFSNKSNAVLPP